MYYDVVLSSRQRGIDNGLTYHSDLTIAPGSLVTVPIQQREATAVVIRAHPDKPSYAVKDIVRVLSSWPLLTTAQLQTCAWMTTYYACSWRQVLQLWLPGSDWTALIPKGVTWYELTEVGRTDSISGSKQQQIIEALQRSALSDSSLRAATGASLATIKTLLKRGIIRAIEQQATLAEIKPRRLPDDTTLTPAQQQAVASISNTTKPVLLYGVTGSGKTEVYRELIRRTLAKGQQALFLLPEIFLAENFVEMIVDFVGKDRTGIMHSHLTAAQRRRLWQRAYQGEIDVLLGSRSALFVPLQQLGLIIVDEEHEWTYKNEQTPRYHVRDTAKALARASGATLVYGSATPSLTAWKAALDGEFLRCDLPERYGSEDLPKVRVVDLADVAFGQHYPLSPTLREAIADRLQKKEQVVLFLNRRGLATALLCLDCRRRVTSPLSQLPFTVHAQPDGSYLLSDHTAGLTVPAPDSCPHCQSVRLHPIGAGTQKLENVLQTLFPRARLLRADRDTMQSAADMQEILRSMKQGDADILLGTQAVVKGLDLPNVTLSAVILADVGLSLPHFQAGERIFQLLTQVAGRSGRHKPGEVIIQTFRPDALEITCSAQHDVEKFMSSELRLREQTSYPPAGELLRFLTRGPTARQVATSFADALRRRFPSDQITANATLFGQGQIWQVLWRSKSSVDLTSVDVSQVIVDREPLDCM